MRCPKCGTENNDSFNDYCVYCGAYLEEKNKPPVVETKENKDKGFKIFLIILVTLIIFFGSFIGGRLLKRSLQNGSVTNYLNIPYALEEIKPGVKITKDLTGNIQIDADFIDNISFLYNDNSLFGNDLCVKEGTKIVKNSYFYIDQLEKCSSNNNYKTFNIEVNNSTIKYMKRGLYIDLYVKIDNNIFGKLFQVLEIDDVLDTSISVLIPKEYESLMNKVKSLKDIEIIPVLVKKDNNKKIDALSNKDLLNKLKEKVG